MKESCKKFIISILLAFLCAILFACQSEDFEITYNVSGGGMVSGELIQSQFVKRSENGTEVTAIPDKGYHFVGWSDGAKNATRREMNVRSDLEFTAIFEREVYSLSYGTNAGGIITGEASQNVEFEGDSTPITAIPDDGYLFAGWSDGRIVNPRREKRVDKSIDAQAQFVEKVKTFTYVYNNATSNHFIPSITFSYDYLAPTTLVVPEKENYIFDGWYLEPDFTTRVTDGDGILYFGHGIFFSDSNKLYAKWIDIVPTETMTFKILMVFVDEIHVKLKSHNGEIIDADYKMSLAERKIHELIPDQISKILNEWFEGLINFEVDMYFTTISLGNESFSSGIGSNERLSYLVMANDIPEVGPLLKNYRSVTTTFCANDYDYLLVPSGGAASEKYASIAMEPMFKGLIMNDDPLDSYLDLSFTDWRTRLYHYLHEFTHTVEDHYGYWEIYEFHSFESYYAGKKIWGLEVIRLYLLSQSEIDGEKVGIPWEYWIGEINLIVNYVPYTVGTNQYSLGGTIMKAPSFNNSIPFGGDAEEVTAVPNEGFRFVGWSDGVMTATRRDIKIISYLNVKAVFEIPPNYFTVRYSYSSRTSGYIVGPIFQGVPYGGNAVTVNAVPETGYRFVRWSDGVMTAVRRDTNITSNIDVEAIFELIG